MRNPDAIKRLGIQVSGAVQGVGFRPFVYRLARRHNLTGTVWNSGEGVFIEAQGKEDLLVSFLSALTSEKPPPAVIDRVSVRDLEVCPESEFFISPSSSGSPETLVAPDLKICSECAAEIMNPDDRRYRYPFTNCTNCGPRFSIILSMPYDRPNTTMKGFLMCPECSLEYSNPSDRRFHAQPVACPACGPRLKLLDPAGRTTAVEDQALRAAADALMHGRILALKGLGGFQLLVRADSDDAVKELRSRKRRPVKPLALMVKSIEEAEKLCRVRQGERDLLLSSAAPITLARYRGKGVSEFVAPENDWLGVMLPATPLHLLLASDTGIPLVATSGNASGEPICIEEDDALEKLAGVADLFLSHDRPIARQVDDSVAASLSDGPLILRRARGYAPMPVHLPGTSPGTLAVGGHQANTVAVTIRDGVVLSQHVGDLDSLAATEAHRRAAEDLESLFGSARSVVRDMHPEYASTTAAVNTGLPCLAVQHHYSHVAACMAENGIRGPVLGVAWDGVGLGTDMTAWGGEFILVDESGSFSRVASLRCFPLPGGDAAALEPRRSGLGLLWEMGKDPNLSSGWFSGNELSVLLTMLQRGVNCPRTSSAGRLFDGIASLLGLRGVCTYRGEAPSLMESLAARGSKTSCYPLKLVSGGGGTVLDWEPMVDSILADLSAGVSLEEISSGMHVGLARGVADAAEAAGVGRVVLTGGCFANRLLTELSMERLKRCGFDVFRHRAVPPGDGGLSLGQAAIGSRREPETGRGSA
jgi:hydrogenase maturation protein HypF